MEQEKGVLTSELRNERHLRAEVEAECARLKQKVSVLADELELEQMTAKEQAESTLGKTSNWFCTQGNG